MSMPRSRREVRSPCSPFPKARCWTVAGGRPVWWTRGQGSGSGQAVRVDKGEGRFEPREVKLGHRGEGFVEVREGLTEDDPVVTSDNFPIHAERHVQSALKGFAEGPQP